MNGTAELKPCMTTEEADLICGYLTKYMPKSCLEWGIGGSTVAFSHFPFIEQWIGIEWHEEWINKVLPLVSERVQLYQAEPPSMSCPYGSPENIKALVHNPAIVGAFDFVFIDADYRWQCLEKASAIVSPTGFCMVHDSARKDMHPSFRNFDHHRILTLGEKNAQGDWHQGLTVLWNGDRQIGL